jgi:serine/threonine protein kinase/tetratricopeptide (TPR) repeat protein
MTPERWQQVKSLFNRALECEPAARAAFLAQEGGEDSELRHEVESLLATHDDADDRFEKPPLHLQSAFLDEDSSAAMLGQHVGPYRLVRELGWGGMGTVYEAVRADEEFRKRVAIKVVRREMASQMIVRRFKHERQILAELNHPNIANLLDGGVTADGRPYFAMEFVEGRPIDEFCTARKLALRERIGLFLEVCAAVQYAHRSLVVHRDLKPSNILVTESGQPKLLDFGIAKLLGEAGAESAAHLTRAGDLFMTPDYACPEQVRGGSITTASDVYSLGIILYELLTGNRPYKLEGRPLQEIVRTITEDEPVQPSAAVSTASDHLSFDGGPARLKRKLAGDLDSIVLKAIRKEPDQRYASVEQLSEDLHRYLEGRPVHARTDSALYRVKKFVRRHTAAVATVGLVILTLMGGIVATMMQARRAEAERVRAEERFDDLRGLANSVLFEIHDSIAELPGTTETRALLVKRGVDYLDRLYRQSSGDTSLEREVASAYIRLGLVQGQPTTANLGDMQGARESFLRALSISQRLFAADPSDREALRTLGQAHDELSDVESWSGNAPAGVVHAREALKVSQQLSHGATDKVSATLPIAISHTKLGDVLGGPYFPNVGDQAGARAEYESALSILEALPRGNTQDDGVARYLALVHERVGALHLENHRYDEAMVAFEKSLSIREARVAANRTNRTAQRDLGVAHEKICTVQLARGDARAATSRCRQALGVYRGLHEADPRDTQAIFTLAIGHQWLYRTLDAEGDLQGALADLERSTQLFRRLIDDEKHHASARRHYARDILYASMLFGRMASERPGSASERAAHRRNAAAYYQRGDELFQQLRADELATADDESILRSAQEKLALLTRS